MQSHISFGATAAFFLALTRPCAAAAQQGCELRFWTTAEAMGVSYRVLDPATRPGPATENALLAVLPAHVQADALERLDLAGLLAMPGVHMIRQSGTLRDGDAAHWRMRLSRSTSPCYAELEVKHVRFRAAPFSGRTLRAAFIFRRFPAGSGPPEIVRGHADVALHIFPGRDASRREAGRDELVAAFGTAFSIFAHENLNRPARR